MSYPPYPYQRKPYTYRQVPYLPVTHYGGGWGNGAAAAGFAPYPGYYVAPAVGPAIAARPRGRPPLSTEEKLRYMKHRLIKDKPADRHMEDGHPEATIEAKKPTPDAAPDVPPAAERLQPPPALPPAIATPNNEPQAAPLPQDETATVITPMKELHYPAKLHRQRIQKLHARNDKESRSPRTVFVIIHEVDGCNRDVQISSSLKDAIHEVLRIMARYHPGTFKLTPLRRIGGSAAAAATASSDENPEKTDGGGVKDEGDEDSINSSPDIEPNTGGDNATANNNGEAAEESPERERRFVYKGNWKFTHASTLKLEAKDGNMSVRVSCALKNVRQEKKNTKKVM
ncbi:uncharacterized protein PG986_005167 [Apiospora aurea]|uniref:Uncharacterized protein n=1 Tax=Apiospora aurea TaxID=335848 RepID=A0ABR1QH28_9PEZI